MEILEISKNQDIDFSTYGSVISVIFLPLSDPKLVFFLCLKSDSELETASLRRSGMSFVIIMFYPFQIMKNPEFGPLKPFFLKSNELIIENYGIFFIRMGFLDTCLS